MKKNGKYFLFAGSILAMFVFWTVAVRMIDVQPIGPRGSEVGFAVLNGAVHRFTGVHMSLYVITDWMGFVPLGVAMGFAVTGLIQWIRRRKLRNVDKSLFVLGGFYIAVIAAYLFFEEFVINYRPILIDGYLEASYPSSTTLLAASVLPVAVMQFNARIKHRVFRRWVVLLTAATAVFMVVARFVSGVHWFSDIVGGILLSAGLVMLYYAVLKQITKKHL